MDSKVIVQAIETNLASSNLLSSGFIDLDKSIQNFWIMPYAAKILQNF